MAIPEHEIGLAELLTKISNDKKIYIVRFSNNILSTYQFDSIEKSIIFFANYLGHKFLNYLLSKNNNIFPEFVIDGEFKNILTCYHWDNGTDLIFQNHELCLNFYLGLRNYQFDSNLID